MSPTIPSSPARGTPTPNEAYCRHLDTCMAGSPRGLLQNLLSSSTERVRCVITSPRPIAFSASMSKGLIHNVLVRLQLSSPCSRLKPNSRPTRRAPSSKAAHVFVPDVRTRPFGSSRSFFTRAGKIKRRFQGTPWRGPASDFFRRRRRSHIARCRLEWMENAYSALCTRS